MAAKTGPILEDGGRTLIAKTALMPLLGITSQAFGHWGVRPAVKHGRQVYFDLREVIDNRIENEQRKANPEGEAGDKKQLATKRLQEEYLLTLERRKGQQLKNEIAAGDVVPTEFATWALSKLAAQIASILDTLPLSVRRAHPDLEPRHIDSIAKEVARARNEAAQVGDTLPELVEQYAEDNGPAG